MLYVVSNCFTVSAVQQSESSDQRAWGRIRKMTFPESSSQMEAIIMACPLVAESM